MLRNLIEIVCWCSINSKHNLIKKENNFFSAIEIPMSEKSAKKKRLHPNIFIQTLIPRPNIILNNTTSWIWRWSDFVRVYHGSHSTTLAFHFNHAPMILLNKLGSFGIHFPWYLLNIKKNHFAIRLSFIGMWLIEVIEKKRIRTKKKESSIKSLAKARALQKKHSKITNWKTAQKLPTNSLSLFCTPYMKLVQFAYRCI